MNTCYISFILLLLVGIIYVVNRPKPIEKFENLSQDTRNRLGQKIRGKDDLESTIEMINQQIEERENGTATTEEIKEEEQTGDNGVYSEKNTKLVNVDLKDYVHKSTLPDMSNYIHRDKMPDMTQYMKRTQMPDMNRYILKTQMPKYPDMSKYILKNQVPKCQKLPDMNKYILKSQIPPPKLCPDMSKFVLKSSVPPIQKPVCPKPDCVKCKDDKKKKAQLSVKEKKKAVAIKNKTSLKSDKANRLVPRNAPVKRETINSETPVQKNIHPVTKPKESQNTVANVYKPKLGKRKCNMFYKIIKNADIYGAY